MRGKKLEAWRIPPIWKSLRDKSVIAPEGSIVPSEQAKMFKAAHKVLTAIAKDMREGLLETVGVESVLSLENGRSSIILALPVETDAAKLARAIDMENVESWCDENNKIHIAVGPWYSTKDIDQTVLSAVKVIHVMLGIHASDSAKPQTLIQKLLSSVTEIMQIQKNSKGKKD